MKVQFQKLTISLYKNTRNASPQQVLVCYSRYGIYVLYPASTETLKICTAIN